MVASKATRVGSIPTTLTLLKWAYGRVVKCNGLLRRLVLQQGFESPCARLWGFLGYNRLASLMVKYKTVNLTDKGSIPLRGDYSLERSLMVKASVLGTVDYRFKSGRSEISRPSVV